MGDVQLLQRERAAEMHKARVYSTADLGMEAYGYGWTRYRQEPWTFWGTFFQFYGAGGHGGGDIGYRTRIYAVEKGEGGLWRDRADEHAELAQTRHPVVL